jgi:hypothetical protein
MARYAHDAGKQTFEMGARFRGDEKQLGESETVRQ